MKLFALHILIVSLSVNSMTTIAQCGDTVVTENKWNLFAGYFILINYVKIVIIHEGKLPPTLFIEQLLQQWYSRFGVPVLLATYDLDYEEETYDYIELFAWNGERFPLRSTQNRSRLVFDDPERSRSLYRNEHKFAVIVIVQNLDILDKYLQGSARRPFHTPRGVYMIAVLEEEDENWISRVTEILRKMWQYYGLLKTTIFSTCNDEHYFRFHPFRRRNTSAPFSINTTEWGVLEKLNMNGPFPKPEYLKRYPRTFNGYPLKSVFFTRKPTAIAWNEFPKTFVNSYFCDVKEYSKELGGFDGILYGNLVKALNFTSIRSEGAYSFGYKVENGTYTGSIGDVLYSRVDVSVNPRFIQDYGTSDTEFLRSVFYDKFCIIAPKAPLIPQSMAIFKCFNPCVWILIITSILLLGSIWEFLKWPTPKRRVKVSKKSRWAQNLIDMIVIMTTGVTEMPGGNVERLFLSGCLFVSLVIGNTFQGSLITGYTTKSYYNDINTLEELDESGLIIATASKSLKGMFGENQSALIQSLQKKFILKMQDTLNRTAYQRDTCGVERRSDFAFVKELFQSPDGTVLLHAIPECPRFYCLAYIVRKGWPFARRFNDGILRFMEAGLIRKWYKVSERSLIYQLRMKRLKNLSAEDRPFSLNDMQSAFYILFIGLALSGIVFMLEYCHKRKSRKPAKM